MGVTAAEVLATAPELQDLAELSEDDGLACDWRAALGLEFQAMIVANGTPSFSAPLEVERSVEIREKTESAPVQPGDMKWIILAEDDGDSFRVMKFSVAAARELKQWLLRAQTRREESLPLQETLGLLEEVPVAILLCDADWGVLHANRAASRLLGVAATGLHHQPLWQVVSERSRGRLRRWLTQRAAEQSSAIEADLIDASGKSLPVVLHVRPSAKGGAARRWWVVVRGRQDFRDRVLASLRSKVDTLTLKLAQTARQMDDSFRLQTEFVSNISHEFRTPLNGVLGYVELLRDGLYGPVTEEQRQALDHVARCANHLLDLITEVMDLSKLKNGQLELEKDLYSPYELVESVADAMQPAVREKELRLEIHCEEGLPSVYVDFHRIYQVLRNLVDNAVKFTHSGQVEIGARRLEDAVEFFVRDTGIGIPEESLTTIFEEFRQADGSTTRTYGGMGIGLSLSRRLVELHGGEMSVESRESHGSTFTFTVPVDRKQD